jgi:very-short-patch-repair endonuclease
LTARNYEVRANVGVAGVFIDLAVVDPDDKNRYVLGIEVDGPGYRNARTARDRERLRESVLSSQGWQLHRIRATEWFQRPTEQLNRLIEAIEAARRNKGKSAGGPLETVYKVERQEPSGDPLSSLTGEAVSVAEAAAPAPSQQSMFTPELQKAMLETVVKVVEVGLKAAVDSQQAKGDETPKKKGK